MVKTKYNRREIVRSWDFLFSFFIWWYSEVYSLSLFVILIIIRRNFILLILWGVNHLLKFNILCTHSLLQGKFIYNSIFRFHGNIDFPNQKIQYCDDNIICIIRSFRLTLTGFPSLIFSFSENKHAHEHTHTHRFSFVTRKM